MLFPVVFVIGSEKVDGADTVKLTDSVCFPKIFYYFFVFK
ncbi:hypothetical protein l11_10520 [Neisseria weaveri LMG 5135]|nr:hypothetical protein l13_14570 [Neisseria weaveri ATCC 51223]EGV37811.1 hypothetical protein l11_10520 [Neisseria weaveri LMG 5135]